MKRKSFKSLFNEYDVFPTIDDNVYNEDKDFISEATKPPKFKEENTNMTTYVFKDKDDDGDFLIPDVDGKILKYSQFKRKYPKISVGECQLGICVGLPKSMDTKTVVIPNVYEFVQGKPLLYNEYKKLIKKNK